MSDNKIFIYDNPDKKSRVRLGRDEFMPLSSSRLLISGPPNVGKRNTIYNIIHRMVPKPSHCHIVHCDPYTTEYDSIAQLGIPISMYSPEDFPDLSNILNPNGDEEEEEKKDDDKSDNEIKEDHNAKPLDFPLVIVDEVTTDILGKENISKFERLVNYICTHKNTCCIVSIQSIMNLPPKIRRAFNHYGLWKQSDNNLNTLVANRAGIKKEVLEDLFLLCKDKHDFIWIDLDSPIDSQWRYRLNWIYPIMITNE